MIPADPAAIRKACGIRQATIAEALGISQTAVSFMERGLTARKGPVWARYARVIAGMARHLSIDEESEQAAA